jgi:hypothetical protein
MTVTVPPGETGTAADRRARHNFLACLGCNLTFSYKGPQGDISGRFCSVRCQAWFDAGNAPPNSPDDMLIGWRVAAGAPEIEVGSDFFTAVFGRSPVAMKRSSDGSKIACFGCGSEFESRGLRCCSDACERRHRERQDNLAAMAQVGIEPGVKRRCAKPGCAKTIPKWRNGRQVSKSTRFCSPKCSRKAKTRVDRISGDNQELP